MRNVTLICVFLVAFGYGCVKKTELDVVKNKVEQLEFENYKLSREVAFLSERLVQLEAMCAPEPEPEVDLASMSVADRIRRVAKQEGYQYPEKLVRLAKCESGLNPHAKLVNRRERSYGVFQINLKAHRHITRAQATDVEWATRWSIERIRMQGFRDWKICSRKMRLR